MSMEAAKSRPKQPGIGGSVTGPGALEGALGKIERAEYDYVLFFFF